MGDDITRESLHGRWFHSREEDQGGQLVYRPQGFKFPPSRGRESFELMPDGSLIRHGFGPTDKTTKAPGRWTLKGDLLELYDDGQTAPNATLRIASVAPDRLVIQR